MTRNLVGPIIVLTGIEFINKMEENKRLAHIERITAIEPIINKKGETMNNVSAQVLGWQCMVKPNEFQVGDLVIYVEPGAIMPPKPEYEFLAKYNFRVKTQQYFQGSYISQGLILPLPADSYILGQYEEGEDVTKLLEITKYYTKAELSEFEEEERQIRNTQNKLKKFMMRYSWFRRLFLSRKQKFGFPYWVSKTEESKIQNIPQVLEQFKDKEVYITEKIDYQSVTFTGKMVPRFNSSLGKLFPKKYQFVVCSRNLTTNDKNSLYWKIAQKYNIEQILKENPTLTIQGEQGDTKVQGNKYGIKEPTMWVFNIIDHEKNYHFNWLEMLEFCKRYNLQYVPLLAEDNALNLVQQPLKNLGSTVQELVEFSKGKSVVNSKVEREGIVVRCIENGKKLLSFKVINPNFEINYNL
jgi:hypothetical protein